MKDQGDVGNADGHHTAIYVENVLIRGKETALPEGEVPG